MIYLNRIKVAKHQSEQIGHEPLYLQEDSIAGA
jgi:hypothetical protein